jgi:hypothetical protein
MAKPRPPTVTIDLTPVYTAIDAVQDALDIVTLSLARALQRVTKLETLLVPFYDEWERAVCSFGDIHGAKFFDPTLSGGARLNLCYYDAALIYRNLGKTFPTHDYLCVRDEAIKIYRDGYVLAQPQPGKVAGIEVFPDGLYWHYKDTGDERSKQAVILMADNAAFSSQFEIDNWLAPLNSSREAAYALRCKLFSRELGGTPVGIESLKNICLGHLKQWRDILDGTNPAPTMEPLQDVRCFMVGLTCQALIEYASRTFAPDIKAAIVQTLNLMWDKMALPDLKTMQYTDRVIPGVGDLSPSPDVNMLIAPAYAWIGQVERADLLFEGGLGAYLTGDKQFNQALRWTWEYFAWRKP